MSFLPTSTEVTQNVTAYAYIFAASGALLAAVLFFRWLLDLIEDFRALRAEEREAARLARLDAIKEDAYYDLSVRLASRTGGGTSWPPVRHQ